MLRRRDAYEARFRAIIADGIATRAFAPVDPVVAASYVLTALNGIVAWYRPAGRVNPAALVEIYTDLSRRVVRARATED